MLSKNNWQEQFRKQEPKKQRFAIKKLTVGVASVLIGFTFMGVSASANGVPANQTTSVPKETATGDRADKGPASTAGTNASGTPEVTPATESQTTGDPTKNQGDQWNAVASQAK